MINISLFMNLKNHEVLIGGGNNYEMGLIQILNLNLIDMRLSGCCH